ncbi:hypothetical protein K490DRAFT_46925 [Saccharata proteae CBS 121410]|uniref:SacI domain-containing protein n=1 Tax=Saccharata proteae CBS 121410 TaxID=1314787 RepID=A0A9P4HPB5_9PEZI|nr:hypothetical protein K490DRAFT_46925 [Saccharata proteae CBS 121410]
MPGLVRKLLIFAAVDGLVLQPAPPRNHPPATQQAVKIDYNGRISPLLKDRREEELTPTSLEAHGIVGLLQVANASFLISISERELVAQIRGRPIYVITDVALIPLSSQAAATEAISHARETLKRHTKENGSDFESESDSEPDDASASDSLSVDETATPVQEEENAATAATKLDRKRTSVAQDVIGKKGVYGRFADRWFSKRGWSSEGRRMQGMSSDEDLSRPSTGSKTPASPRSAPQDSANAGGTAKQVSSPLSPDGSRNDAAIKPAEEVSANLPEPSGNTTNTLLPKILRTTKLYFSSRSFFFSYDYDMSRSLAQQSDSTSSSLPLFKLFDPLFFWNHRIISPFIEAGQHNFVLPLLQGFVGQRAFSVDVSSTSSEAAVVGATSDPTEVVAAQDGPIKRPGSPIPSSPSKSTPVTPQITAVSVQGSVRKDFLLTLISRRSIKRAGLRYLRRGVDDAGNVANSVETEQILSPQSWETTQGRIYSFLQYRGSIPLFFSQSPYSLKPLPVIYGSEETNAAAFKRHFQFLASRYGGVQVASLVDKHGSESTIGEAFEKQAHHLNESGGIDGKGNSLGFEWFDFHNVCRGMKFENVSLLMSTLGPSLSTFGWTIQDHNQITSRQTGVLRTNCMDCLDRTNVVQSACAREALEQQLASQHISIDLQTDPKTAWFNTLWADNGDAISKQYSGTAALKGDYTRTRHRSARGALTDFGLTLTRYYNNIVNDYFAQAVIDYLLGRATESIFADFEDDMKAQDYAIDLRKVRQLAISRCAEIVIEDAAEDLVHGWTLSCPKESGALRALPFEECVLLLTERALYFCRFDWGTEKVRGFERIELERVVGLVRGTYITSTLARRHMDEKKNVGFVVRYRLGGGDEVVRVNTRSLANETEAKKDTEDAAEHDILAFKALPPKSSFASSTADTDASSTGADADDAEPLSEVDLVKSICDEVRRVALAAKGIGEGVGGGDAGAGNGEGVGLDLEVEERDIISLAEAKKSTGYLEQIGYSLKKLVWA